MTELSLPDCYKLFDIPYGCSNKQLIKERYHSLIKQYHPDKSQKDTNHQFIKIKKAYDILSTTKPTPNFIQIILDFIKQSRISIKLHHYLFDIIANIEVDIDDIYYNRYRNITIKRNVYGSQHNIIEEQTINRIIPLNIYPQNIIIVNQLGDQTPIYFGNLVLKYKLNPPNTE